MGREPKSELKGVARTIEVLSSTRNEAANDVLIAGLESPQRKIQYAALRAILERDSDVARQHLIHHWHEHLDYLKMIVAEAPGKLHQTIRDLAWAQDSLTVTNACDAAQWIRHYDLIGDLLEVAESRKTGNGDIVAQTLLDLCERMREELDQPHAQRHLRTVRNRALAKLAVSAERFSDHGRTELVEALLLLAEQHAPPLRRILRDPQHVAHRVVLETLATSPRVGIIKLLCSFLDDVHAPRALIRTIGRRCDLSFLRAVFKIMRSDPCNAMRKNLRQLERLQFTKEDLGRVFSLVDAEQAGAMQMIHRSGISRKRTFELIQLFLDQGSAGGRCAAVQTLGDFNGEEANQLLLKTVNDPDPEVQAAALLQLRDRQIPGAITRLIQFVESPHEVVREAAKQCLHEFNLDRYLHFFETMEMEARINTGQLVFKIDGQAGTGLLAELQSGNRTRRLRALRAAPSMGAVIVVEDAVVAALNDEDHFVRAEAARALGTCDTPMSRTALNNALQDSSVSVQHAAKEALDNLVRTAAPTPAPTAGDTPYESFFSASPFGSLPADDPIDS